jgi:hypothetical protein
LIDGDGNFSYKHFTLVFNISDASLAYYIKERIGYGNISKIPGKNAIKYVVTNKIGIEKIINLVNQKLRVQFKIDSIYKYLINAYSTKLNLDKELLINTSNNLDNYWLAGFSDADASFQIKILSRKRLSTNPRMLTLALPAATQHKVRAKAAKEAIEIRINYQIDQKTKNLLELIKDYFGGNIGYRSSQDTYYYGSTSFGVAKSVINYFDKFPMLSSKHLNYLK